MGLSKFEYSHFRIRKDEAIEEFIKKLNLMGQQGWQVVTIWFNNDAKQTNMGIVYLMRELSPDSGGGL